MIDVAALTLKELMRRRFLAGAAVATAVLVAAIGWGFSILPHIHRRGGAPITHLEVLTLSAVLLILISYLFSFLLAMAAVFVAAPSIASDIESGVLLPVLARPISRGAILGGKLLAIAGVIVAYAFITGVCEFAVVKAATGYLPPHPLEMLAFLSLSGIVMVCLAMLLGTRMPAVAASIVAMGLFIVARLGGIAQSIGLHYANETVTTAGTISQLLLPSDAMWHEALYRLEPAGMIAALSRAPEWPGPFFIVAPPPTAMILWTIGWIAVAALLASRSFELRDL